MADRRIQCDARRRPPGAEAVARRVPPRPPALSGWLAQTLGPAVAAETTVVLDASVPPGDFPSESNYKGLSVLFALGEENADARIEALIRADSSPKALTVVSSDNRIRLAASKAPLPVAHLREVLGVARQTEGISREEAGCAVWAGGGMLRQPTGKPPRRRFVLAGSVRRAGSIGGDSTGVDIRPAASDRRRDRGDRARDRARGVRPLIGISTYYASVQDELECLTRGLRRRVRLQALGDSSAVLAREVLVNDEPGAAATSRRVRRPRPWIL